jgi:hypothetical protein
MIHGFKAHNNSIGLVRHDNKYMTSGFSALNCQRFHTAYLNLKTKQTRK